MSFPAAHGGGTHPSPNDPPITGTSQQPPASKARHTSLSESARLHDLSYDLRAIHHALLPEQVGTAIERFNAQRSPGVDDARMTLKIILEGSESLMDALLACRLVEGSVDLAARQAPHEADQKRLQDDFATLIAMLAGRLSLGALHSILRADGIGLLRGAVRAYRMERFPPSAPPSTPKPSASAPASQQPPRPQDAIANPWAGWLKNPRGLPVRNRLLALSAVGMVTTLPIFGGIATHAGAPAIPLWSAIAALMAGASLVAVLTSPYRHPAQRFSQPTAPLPPKPSDSASSPVVTSAPLQAPQPPAQPPILPTSVSLARQEASLRRQGLDVAMMDETALTDWIERSGTDIAHLLQTARSQSLAANIAAEDED